MCVEDDYKTVVLKTWGTYKRIPQSHMIIARIFFLLQYSYYCDLEAAYTDFRLQVVSSGYLLKGLGHFNMP